MREGRRNRAGAMRRRQVLWLLPLLLATAGSAANWPQWRGPARDGISPERGWQSRWPPAGPRRLWTASVGQGYSGLAIVGSRVYTMGNDGSQDAVHCLDAATGKPIWTYRYPCAPGDYGGPRATPTVLGGRVYTLSREGLALCLDAASGKRVWETDLRRAGRTTRRQRLPFGFSRTITTPGIEPPRWGFAGSPLLYNSLVIYNAGEAGAALDRNTGAVVWKSAGTAGYASPVPFAIGEQRGVALFTAFGLVAVEPETGRRLWQHPWNTAYDVNAADPIFWGDSVFISSNYNKGCALIRLSGGKPTVVWQNRVMRNHINSCVRLGGYVYGNDENTLKCVDLSTGEERWRLRGIGKGGLIASDGKLIVLSERGELIVALANPERYVELARARVMTGTCWTAPALADGRLYCRNHEGEVAAFDLRPAGRSGSGGRQAGGR